MIAPQVIVCGKPHGLSELYSILFSPPTDPHYPLSMCTISVNLIKHREADLRIFVEFLQKYQGQPTKASPFQAIEPLWLCQSTIRKVVRKTNSSPKVILSILLKTSRLNVLLKRLHETLQIAEVHANT